ncbi:MAG: thiamine phosphate synthase [Myxococcales bacterium]|nr:thiamine phosphate synthase [Myxococcales bacterium]
MGLSEQRLPFRLLLITDRVRFPRPTQWAEYLLSVIPNVPPQALGLWIREKDLAGNDLWRTCNQLTAELHSRGITTIISSRADIGNACRMWGVNVGWDAPPSDRIRRSFPHLAVGRSCHPPNEIEEICGAAADGCQYVVTSPVFPTPKPYPIQCLGLIGLERVVKFANVPVVALGGIDGANIRSVLRAGAGAAACMSSIWTHQDPCGAIANLVERCLDT